MYVDYEYYIGQYGGNISECNFFTFERKAENYIRSITYVKGNIFSVENDAVKDAVCALTDLYFEEFVKRKINQQGIVKSENNDGYSVSYVTEQTDGQTVEELLNKKAYDTVYMYLLPTGWLSRKVGCGYDHKRMLNDLSP